jgi:DNA gyrase subunit B
MKRWVVAILPGNRIRVADNGRGIPVEIHPKTKVSTLETVLTVLHAGGKFGGEGYKYSGGLHGVGVSVVNALSTHVRAEVHRDGGRHVQEYKNGGKPVGKTQRLGPSKRRGTVITFTPDPSIFPEIVFDIKTITNHLRRQAYLVPGMRITVIDAREFAGKLDDTAVFYLREAKLELTSNAFYFEGGIRSLIAFQNRQLQLLHKNIFYVQKEVDNVLVEVALQYVDDISSRISAYANNIYNPEGGTHVTGFKTALTRSLNTYLKKSGAKSEEAFTGDDVLEGLTAVVSVKLREIQFEGQTKAKLGSVEARGAVDTVFAEGLAAFLEEHPEDAKAMVNKAILAMRARKAAKAAKDSILRKGALEGLTLPGKLADCQTNRAEESELFIVEGDSAGGSSKQGRDRRTQAILPLRGKILNVERARLDRMLASEEIKNLVVAMGTGIGDMFNIEKLRYHKIIIATDADVDGAHIRTLLMTLFYRHFPKVMEGGFLYIAQPPLFKITKGKEVFYAYNDAERLAVTGDIKIEEVSEVSEEEEPKEEVAEVKRSPKLMVQRYKGLGEMNPEELWETTMDPQRRVLKQVTIADAESANKVFDMLMGTDVSGRKTFIQSHATEATLDV